MSLSVYLTAVRPTCVFDWNITHNLGKMAAEAGLYQCLWTPEEIGVETADHLIPYLIYGLGLLEANPLYFKQFNPPNNWGDYEGFVQFVRTYLAACRLNPDAKIEVSR